jgi:hypothetical protein
MKFIFFSILFINACFCFSSTLKYNNYSTKFWEKGLIDSVNDVKLIESGDILISTKNGVLAKIDDSSPNLTSIKNKYTYNNNKNKDSKIFVSDKCK